MRILVDIRHLVHPNPSGVGEYTIQLLRALFEIDRENEYVLFSTGTRTPNLDAYGFPATAYQHVHIPLPNKVLNARLGLLGHPTINWFVKDPVDLIFLPNLNIAPLPIDVPTVLTIHDLSWKLFPEFYSKRMLAWHKACKPHELINQAAHIIVPSESTKNDLLSSLLATRPSPLVSVIPHGVDPIFSPRMEARDHGVRSRLKLPKNFVLFVGTLEPRKNLVALIDGVKEYREKTRDDLHLVLVGKWGWKSRAIKKRLWKRDTKTWVHHLGYADKKNLPAIYRSAKALVWPSMYEGFGLPVLEAMASGTPVITSHTSSLPQLTGTAAIHIDPYNSRDITTALKELLGSQELQRRLTQAGVERARSFSWSKTATQTLDLFKEVC